LLFVPLCILNTQHTCHACFVQHVMLYVASSAPLDLLSLFGLGGVNWILLAQDRGRWRAVVSAVMNLRVLAPQS
jgi:hypothetical protein